MVTVMVMTGRAFGQRGAAETPARRGADRRSGAAAAEAGPPRVVLVTHEASRSGAPRVAVLIARAFAEEGYPTTVVSRADGPLMKEFGDFARSVVEPLWRARLRLSHVKGVESVGWALDTATALFMLILRPSDVVYVNSTSAAVYVRPSRWLGRQTILHVHESFDVATAFLKRARVGDLSDTELIACSPSVEADLRRLTRGVQDVQLIPSVPDDRAIPESRRGAGDDARTRAGSDPGSLLVGACGAAGYRKGTDLWLEIANRVLARSETAPRFVWVGDYDAERYADIPPQVNFVGPTSDPQSKIAEFDIGVLTSRDDPFPLVVLETMLMGVPVVAFDVGGVREQIGDAGILVPPEDVDAFADAVTLLLTDAELRRSLGAAARERAVSLYSTSAFSDRVRRVVGTAHRGRRC